MAARQSGVDYVSGKKVMAIAEEFEVARGSEPVASLVPLRRDRGAVAPQGTRSSAQAQPGATRGAHR
jgi:antitoxin (DNA-binding transcriptional repressor) of toxin-antitoxin stability system